MMNVSLLAITPNGEDLVAQAYGICTSKIVPVENIPTWIGKGHLSPLEHISATFKIEEISRACMAQLTRHRLASFSVESMRYVDVTNNSAIKPDTLKDDHVSEFVDAWYESTSTFYQQLIASGVPKADARFILPIGTTTQLIMTANVREWMHIFKLRCAPAAHWEIRGLCGIIRQILAEEWPNIIGESK